MENILYLCIDDHPIQSIHNCVQTLQLMDIDQQQCTVNGEYLDVRRSKRLWTRITCQGYHAPQVPNLELGTIVKIGSIQRLWKKVTPEKIIRLKYMACNNSIQGHDLQGQVLCHLMGCQEISIPSNVEFISYKPWLNMMVTDMQFSNQHHAWRLEATDIQ